MGGKSKTYTSIEAQHIFAEDEDLFLKDIMRNYIGFNYSLDGIAQSVAVSSTKYFNSKFLEAYGVLTEADVILQKITLQKTADKILETDPHEVVVPYSVATIDTFGNYINPEAYFYKRYFEDNFDIEVAVSINFNYMYTLSASGEKYCSDGCTAIYPTYLAPTDLHNTLHGSIEYDVSFMVETNIYSSDSGTTWYGISLPITYDSDGKLKMSRYEQDEDDNWIDTGEIYWQVVPTNADGVLCVKYATREDRQCMVDDAWSSNCYVNPNGWSENFILLLKSDIIPVAENRKMMLLPVKHDREFTISDPYIKALLNGYGFNASDLEAELDNDEIVESLFTYSTNKSTTNSFALEMIRDMYGWSGTENTVSINTDFYDILYDTEVYFGDDGMGNLERELKYSIEFNGVKKIIGEDDKLMIIPIDSAMDLTIIERYDLLRDSFALWGNMQVTVELEWYQTGLFRFAMMMIGMIAAVLSGPVGVAMFIGGSIVGRIAYEKWGAEGALAVGVLLAVATYGASLNGSFASLAETATHAAQIAATLAIKYFQMKQSEQLAELTAEAEEYEELTKEEYQSIEDMKSEFMYQPLASIDNYYIMSIDYPLRIADFNQYDMLGMIDKSSKTGGML